MLSLGQWLTFIAIATFLVLIPGADTVLVIRTAMQRGRASALVVALGICTGLFIWGAATALGLAALFQSSHLAHDLLSVAGAGYLIFLGLRTLRSHHNPLESQSIKSGPIFLTGFFANLLNPKVAIFYLSIFSQFITTGPNAVWQGLSLALVHFLLSMVWFVILTSLLSRILSDIWRRRISRISGTALVAFGLTLIVPVVTSASAATVISAPLQTNLYSLGSPDSSFANFASTQSGSVLIGTLPADVSGSSWNIGPGLGGDDILIATVDVTGKTQWTTRVGTAKDDAGVLVGVDASGVIWSVGLTSGTAPATPAAPGALDPDNVGSVGDDEGPTGPNQMVLTQLLPTGEVKAQSIIDAPAGTALAPAKILIVPTGAIVVGSATTNETGETRGFIASVDAQLQTTFAFVGTTNTTITDAELLASGIQIAGGSAEELAGKKLVGIRDAFTATWNGSLTNVIRSGSKGVDRIWNSLTPTATGYLLAGSVESAGKVETAVTSLKKNGKVNFTLRYPASEDQLVFSGNRLALTVKVAHPAFPGWRPRGLDLLIITLDPKGKTSALTAISGAGNEELVAISPKLVLGRTSGPLPKAIGQGNVMLARISR